MTAIPEPEPFAKVKPSELKLTFLPNQLVLPAPELLKTEIIEEL